MVEAVRPIALADIEEARERIAGTVLRTPLVRLDLGPDGPDIRLKLENLQPTNAYKIRGAANAVGRLSGAERARGVWTVSAGNAGQGVAYAAPRGRHPLHRGRDRDRAADQARPHGGARRDDRPGAPTKSPGRRSPTMSLTAWTACSSIRSTITISSPATRTMGLEILEDAPDIARGHHRDRRRRADHRRRQRDQGAAARHQNISARSPRRRRPSLCRCAKAGRAVSRLGGVFVDGAGGQSVTERMWERMRPVVDGAIIVTLEQTRQAMRLLADKARVIAEGAGALSPAAALTGEAGEGPIVCVISGGNIDLAKFASLVTA